MIMICENMEMILENFYEISRQFSYRGTRVTNIMKPLGIKEHEFLDVIGDPPGPKGNTRPAS